MKAFSAMGKLFGILTSSRRKHLVLVAMLVIAGAFAEVIMLGAVIPFVTVMIAPDNFSVPALIPDVLIDLLPDLTDQPALSMTLLFMVVVLVASATRVALTWCSNSFVFSLGNEIATRIYGNILAQPYSYHVNRNSAETIGAIGKVQVAINNVLFHIMRACVSVVVGTGILLTLFIIEPLVAFCTLFSIGIIFASIRYCARNVLAQNSRITNEAQAKRVQIVQESIGGIREVILADAAARFVGRFDDLDRVYQRASMINATIARIPRFVVEGLGMIIIALIALIMVSHAPDRSTVLPTIGLIVIGAQRLLPLMQDMYQALTHISGHKDILLDILRLAELPRNRCPAPDPAAKPFEFNRSIALQNVTFSYPGRSEAVLRNVSLAIKKGSVTGISGGTGNGKSTLVDLLLGLQKPRSGKLLIDDREPDKHAMWQWWQKISHVPQSIFLMDASIAENIAFGNSDGPVDPGRISHAAQIAGIDRFIVSLPEGYETPVGERGISLSGGQLQRIGIARAIYNQADILVLDEATSALDEDKEREVIRSVLNACSGTTILMISHRPSVLKLCEQLLVVEDGRAELRKPGTRARTRNNQTKNRLAHVDG